MNLILIRHAHATWADRTWPDDNERPLTELGHRQAALVGAALKRAFSTVDHFLTSPLLRARETGEVIRREAGWPEPQIHDVGPGLERELVAGRTTWAAGLVGELSSLGPQTVAYVGHEPTLSEMVSLLLTGSEDPKVEMERAAAAFVRFEGPIAPGAGVLAWLVIPELVDDLL